MKKFFIIIFSSLAFFNLLSCKSKDKPEKTVNETAVQADQHEETNTTIFTEEQMKSIGIALGSIEEKQLTASLKATGMLRVPNQNKASVSSVYSGIIESLYAHHGSFVKKGQVLATISNPDFVHVQSEYLALNSKVNLAELDLKRQEELNAGNAGALKNMQAAETNLKTLRTTKSTLEQQIRLMGIDPNSLANGKLISVLSVTSPINGVISDVSVQIGSYVSMNTVIAEIVDNSHLHVDLHIYEKDLPKLKNDQIIHFTLTNNPGKEYDAQIYSLGSSFEGDSKAISLHARVLGDKAGLIDGMNITAAISLDKKTVPAVPTEAIVTEAGLDFIFIVKEEQHSQDGVTGSHSHTDETTFEKIPVAKGTTDIGFTEITLLKEIPKGSKIVVTGAFFVLAKMTNSGEHEH